MIPSLDTQFEQSRPRLMALAHRIAGQDAEDLVGDAYVRMCKSMSYDHNRPFEPWAKAVMLNLWKDCKRRQSIVRFQPLVTFTDGEERPLELPDTLPTPEEVVTRDQFSEPIHKALAAMRPEFRVCLLLSDVEELSYDEIAAAVGVPVGTVRSRIHRGRKSLRQALGGGE